MAERLLLLPPWWQSSPRGLDTVPMKGLIEALEERFTVDVFAWPTGHGGSHVPPTFEAVTRLIAEAFVPGCHVLDCGLASVEVLTAVSRARNVRSLVLAGMTLPPATYEALGRAADADTARAVYSMIMSPRQIAQFIMQGAGQDEIDKYTRMIEESVDWAFVEAYNKDTATIDLTTLGVVVQAPTLLLQTPLQLPADAADVLGIFCPHLSVGQLADWSIRTHLPEATAELTQRVIDFADRVGVSSLVKTVLFTDIAGSTERAAEIGGRRWQELLSRHRADVRRELALHSGSEVDTAGDGFLATFDSAATAVRCAAGILARANEVGLQLRAGLHTGECQVGGEKVSGLAVHIAARVMQAASPGEILVSETVKQLLVGSSFRFDYRGCHDLKGVPEQWRLYSVQCAAS
jgi:class 3 adenylate cyclase